VDVFRLHNKNPEQYTFWDYRLRNAVEKKKGWRIDHIWATKTMAGPRLSDKPSDHTIVVAEFNI